VSVISVPCPFCGAPSGAPCANMNYETVPFYGVAEACEPHRQRYSNAPAFTSSEVFTVPAGDVPVVGWFSGGGPIDFSGGDTATILALLSQMTESVRYEAIKSIIECYCQHCGTSNKPPCQCWNDE
jgi:hypothetical protein